MSRAFLTTTAAIIATLIASVCLASQPAELSLSGAEDTCRQQRWAKALSRELALRTSYPFVLRKPRAVELVPPRCTLVLHHDSRRTELVLGELSEDSLAKAAAKVAWIMEQRQRPRTVADTAPPPEATPKPGDVPASESQPSAAIELAAAPAAAASVAGVALPWLEVGLFGGLGLGEGTTAARGILGLDVAAHLNAAGLMLGGVGRWSAPSCQETLCYQSFALGLELMQRVQPTESLSLTFALGTRRLFPRLSDQSSTSPITTVTQSLEGDEVPGDEKPAEDKPLPKEEDNKDEPPEVSDKPDLGDEIVPKEEPEPTPSPVVPQQNEGSTMTTIEASSPWTLQGGELSRWAATLGVDLSWMIVGQLALRISLDTGVLLAQPTRRSGELEQNLPRLSLETALGLSWRF